ncbi:UNVERIFIED_CONTAM: hypothetical protein GTU68_023836 [Idotea baltica]|nr:hypothetical protein [Idotea baltica]
MLDIVFILLIFFIVTSSFIREDVILLEAPQDTSVHGPPQSAIIIAIDHQNLIRVNNRLTDISSVRAGIERVKAENPDASVVIRADRAARNGLVIQIRDAAYSAGFNDRVAVMLTERAV